MVYSQQAYDREKKTFERNLIKKSEALKNALWHLGNQVFGCEADIEKEVKKLKKDYPLHSISTVISPAMKNPGKGRPKPGTQKIRQGFQVTATAQVDESSVKAKLNTKGRFVLASNDLDTEALSDFQILNEY